MSNPKITFLGTNDKSIRKVPLTALQAGQHTAKFLIYAAKGPTEDRLMSPNELVATYGAETFTEDSPFYNPAIKYLSKVGAAAGSVVVKRLEPLNSANALVNLNLEIKTVDVEVQARDADGNLTGESEGLTTNGIEYMFTATTGVAEIKTDIDNNVTSYPIMTVNASSVGKAANDIGFALSVADPTRFDTVFLDKAGVFPLEFSLHNKEEGIQHTILGDTVKKISAWKGTKHPITNQPIDGENITYGTWYSEEDGEVYIPREIDEPIMHYDNIQNILSTIAGYELEALQGLTVSPSDWHDMTPTMTSDIAAKLGNIVSFKTSKGKDYLTVVPSTSASAFDAARVDVSINTPIYLQGGEDGDTSWLSLQSQIVTEMKAYLDTESRVQDLGINFDRIMYDCDYSLETSLALCNYIALRPDTAVVLNTVSYDEPARDLSEERSIAVLLKNRLELTPESPYYNTPVMRGAIIGGDGLWKENRTLPRISQAVELGMKLARFTGAANGEWNADYDLNGNPGNIVEELVDLQPDFIPPGAKASLWEAGMNYTESVDKRYQWDAIQTVYSNDTSVLNSLTTAIAVGTINRAAFRVYKAVVGRKDLSNAQLAKLVVKLLNKELKNAFTNITVIPRVEFTAADEATGSWRVICNLYDNLIRKEMTHTVEAHRFSDLGA